MWVGVTAPSSEASWYVHGLWTQVLIKQLVVRQEDSEKEVRGPPASKAFDAEGKPTKVIKRKPVIGFLFDRVWGLGSVEYIFCLLFTFTSCLLCSDFSVMTTHFLHFSFFSDGRYDHIPKMFILVIVLMYAGCRGFLQEKWCAAW
jgi:hypothetical protein